MAFSLDPPSLIAQLRATYLLSADDSSRFISSFPRDPDPEGSINTILQRKHLSASPPIFVNDLKDDNALGAADALHKSQKRRSRIRHRKRKSTSEPSHAHKTSITSLDDVETPIDDADDLPMELNYTKTKGKSKARPTLIRFFHKDKDSDDDSDGSIRTMKMNPVDDEDSNDSDSTQKLNYSIGSQDQVSEGVTLETTSTVSVPTEVESERLQSITSELPDSESKTSPSVDEDTEEYDYSDEEEYDDEYEDDDVSSTDSAFTDIEADSMIDSSLLLDSYEVDTPEFTFDNKKNILENLSHESKKARKHKARHNSYGTLNSTKPSSTYNPASTSTKGDKLQPISLRSSNSSSVLYSLAKQSAKRSVVKFEKIDPSSSTKVSSSKLSSLIQSKYKSTNNNPLHYYSFADSEVASANVKKVKLNIYVPPKTTPTLKELSVNNNITIVDCIGYILLHLTGSDPRKVDPSSLDPNHWRLELVDEDGENYGSFGILDRTRLLSSYNNPTELAICSITNENEIAKNEKQSPLPLEFKQDLHAFTQKGDGESDLPDSSAASSTTIDFKILVAFGENNKQTFSFSTDSQSTVKELLYDFCNERNLNASNYRLRVIMQDGRKRTDDFTLSDGNQLDQHSSARLLNNNELLNGIESDFLEIVPSKNLAVNSLASGGSENVILGGGITPNDPMTLITPAFGESLLPRPQVSTSPDKEDEKTQTILKLSNKLSKVTTSERVAKSDKMLDDIITGFNSDLPTNLTTIYFKWKVWRKKTTILNKIEKSLIIDGDYIHLAPSDDVVLKRNPSDNPFSSSHSQSTSHHHLHHYNYANYYNSSIMKTSSFHITQIVKLKQYKDSKNPNHFKIVIQKPPENPHAAKEATKKKYYLEAVSEKECEEIIAKIKWVKQVYSSDVANLS